MSDSTNEAIQAELNRFVRIFTTSRWLFVFTFVLGLVYIIFRGQFSSENFETVAILVILALMHTLIIRSGYFSLLMEKPLTFRDGLLVVLVAILAVMTLGILPFVVSAFWALSRLKTHGLAAGFMSSAQEFYAQADASVVKPD